jgi:hypothetical protein
MHSLNVPAVAMLGSGRRPAAQPSTGIRLVRRIRSGRPGWRWRWAGRDHAQDLAVLYAALGDEGLAKPLA